MRIAEGVYFYEGDQVDTTKTRYFQLYRGMAASNFLVIPGETQIMIDSGIPFGPHVDRLKRELLSDRVDVLATRRILLSHSHPDHTLGAKKLAKEHGAEVVLHEAEREMVKNDRHFFRKFFDYPPHVQFEIFQAPDWVIMYFMHLIGMDFGSLGVDFTFDGGDSFATGAGEAIVFPLPAHCPGHAGFHFPSRKLLYCADLFDFRCTEGASLMAANSIYEQAFKDIAAVRKLDIDILVPGHGKPVMGKAKIARTLDRVERASERFVTDALKTIKRRGDKGLNVMQLAGKMFPGTITYNAFSRRVIAYHSLNVLKRQGKADYDFSWGRAYWKAKAGAKKEN